ncbi:MAG: VCBS repeat-containing protein [Deltaproteobacteria bacterium]|nr:VCBS repeat-containing protein [Deltaproteobacteria bacterium]
MRVCKLFIAAAFTTGCALEDPEQPEVNSLQSEIRQPLFPGPTELLGTVEVIGVRGCSGVAISSTAVLTAAHCVCMDGLDTCVTTAKVRVRTTPTFPMTTIPEVRGNVVVHPDFESHWTGIRVHDMAIVLLSSPLPGHVTPTTVSSIRAPVGTDLLVAGYGFVGASCQSTLPNGQLAYQHNVLNSYDDGDNFIVSNQLRTCQGDSGGPVFADDGTMEPKLVLGVTFGQDWHFVPPGLYDTTTTTHLHYPWIRAVVTDLFAPLGEREPWTAAAAQGQRGTLVADVDGDGRADAILLNNTQVTVRRSSGVHFGTAELAASGPAFGTVLTAVADVDGDGLADLIAVNSNGITARRSAGTTFFDATTMSNTAYVGQVGTFFADVDGDGRADAIAVNNGNITVRRSNGRSFDPPEVWVNSSIEVVRFGDVNGDGRADLITIARNRLVVRLSTGTTFGSVATWWDGVDDTALLDFHVADLNKDNRADVILNTSNGVIAHPSLGNSFGPPVELAPIPLLGTFGTHIADVTGDGRADIIMSNSDGLIVRRRRPAGI